MVRPSLSESNVQHRLRDLSELHVPQPGCLAPFPPAKMTGPLLCKMLGAPAGRKKPVLPEWSEGEKMKGRIHGNLSAGLVSVIKGDIRAVLGEEPL